MTLHNRAINMDNHILNDLRRALIEAEALARNAEQMNERIINLRTYLDGILSEQPTDHEQEF